MKGDEYMDTAIKNGNIVLGENGKPYTISGIDEALQRARICLEIKKGSFIFLPSLGSELWRLDATKPYLNKQADMFVREALAGLRGITVMSVCAVADGSDTDIAVEIEYMGQTGRLEVTVNGAV